VQSPFTYIGAFPIVGGTSHYSPQIKFPHQNTAVFYLSVFGNDSINID